MPDLIPDMDRVLNVVFWLGCVVAVVILVAASVSIVDAAPDKHDEDQC